MRGLLVLLLCVWPSLVHAQGQSAAAEALFDAGRAAAAAGDAATACEKFRESHRLEPGIGALLNIGDCSEKLGNLVDAWQSYSEALKLLPNSDRRLPYATERFEAIGTRIARLTLQLAEGAPAATEVVRDQVSLAAASFGVALPIEPARDLTLVVQAPGHEDRVYHLKLAEGERLALTVQPGAMLAVVPAPVTVPVPMPASTPAPSPEPEPPPVSNGDKGVSAGVVLGWSSVALGAVFTAVGVVTAIDLAGRRSDLDDLCDDDGACRASAESSIDAFNDRRVVSTASFVAGGVFVSAGVLLLLLLPDDDEAPTVAPLVGPGFAGVRGTL